MAHISIYLTNLGKYNEGELVGEWVDLPVSDEELQNVFNRIGISDKPDPETGSIYEEYFITDYESDIPGIYVDEYENLSTLNELAEKIENFDDYDLKIYKNAMEAGYVDSIDDFDSSDYIFYEDVDSDYELGEIMAEETGLSEDTLETYFDYDAFGRDLDLEFDIDSWIDDEEEAKEQYGVDDIYDITAYDYFGVSSDYELAEQYIEMLGSISELGKDTLETYFDYDSFGRDCAFDGFYSTDGFIMRL